MIGGFMKRKVLVVALLVLVPLLSLGNSLYVKHKTAHREQSAALPKDVSPADAEKLRSLGYIASGSPESKAPASPIVRKIIRSGEFTLQVTSLDSFSRSLEKKLQESGGYISAFEMNHNASGAYATITIKVNQENLDRFSWWLKEAGNVTNQKMNTEDISEQYYDLKARLANARTLEKRLQEMVETHTAGLSDLLEVEEKLSAVRENIESMEAT